MQGRYEEHEVVELLAAVGRWPAGTAGTVVRGDATIALVEIVDDRGHAVDFVSVPNAGLAASERPARARASR